MRRYVFAPILALALAVSLATTPALAITGGQPDGNDHPYVGLLLAPGITFCSGALIDEDTILTAGHCTYFWDLLLTDPEYEDLGFDGTIMVSFDPQASVDEDWMPAGGTWYEASNWVSHPDYVDEEWPFTWDYGLLYLDDPVGITPAELPTEGLLDELLPANGQTALRFDDVGYGVQGQTRGGGPPRSAITWQRKIAVQRYAPGKGATSGVFHPTWFSLRNAPSPRHGGACGGDSGSPVLVHDTDTIVAVHTGGYRLGRNGVICGRISSLNHRIDIDGVLDWIVRNM